MTHFVCIGRYNHNGDWTVTQIYGSGGTLAHATAIAQEYNKKHDCDDAYVKPFNTLSDNRCPVR